MKKATIYDFARFCEQYNDCEECPIIEFCFGENTKEVTSKANETILNWVKEHPIKTRQSKFLKMFPNAQISSDGVIEITPCAIEKNKYITSNSSCTVAHGFNNCDECRKKFWLAEVDENDAK